MKTHYVDIEKVPDHFEHIIDDFYQERLYYIVIKYPKFIRRFMIWLLSNRWLLSIVDK